MLSFILGENLSVKMASFSLDLCVALTLSAAEPAGAGASGNERVVHRDVHDRSGR